MAVVADVRRCLEDLDTGGFRPMWDHFFPHMSCPRAEADLLTSMHIARTASKAISSKARFYSHRWLTERGFKSLLPDHLRPRAERMYPQIVQAVGISCNATSPIVRPILPFIQQAMESSVLESFGDNVKDPDVVRTRMLEARANVTKKLVGIILPSIESGAKSFGFKRK